MQKQVGKDYLADFQLEQHEEKGNESEGQIMDLRRPRGNHEPCRRSLWQIPRGGEDG